MNVSTPKMPELVKSFSDLLWSNIPKTWVINDTFFQDILFISIIIDQGDNSEILKIQREYQLSDIQKRSDDLWGLAMDCAEEICHSAKSK